MTSTQTMKPSAEAKTVLPASVQSAAPSTIPTPSTAMPPAMPARPNQRAILRARQAASEEPMIAVAAQAEAGAAEHDDARKQAVGVEADQPGPEARDEPEVAEDCAREDGRRRLAVVGPEDQRRHGERDVEEPESRQPGPCHRREATQSRG